MITVRMGNNWGTSFETACTLQALSDMCAFCSRFQSGNGGGIALSANLKFRVLPRGTP